MADFSYMKIVPRGAKRFGWHWLFNGAKFFEFFPWVLKKSLKTYYVLFSLGEKSLYIFLVVFLISVLLWSETVKIPKMHKNHSFLIFFSEGRIPEISLGSTGVCPKSMGASAYGCLAGRTRHSSCCLQIWHDA